MLRVCCRYGEVVNINLVRDKKTGKSKGFCFLCYEDQRSTILAVDNFNGIKVNETARTTVLPARWGAEGLLHLQREPRQLAELVGALAYSTTPLADQGKDDSSGPRSQLSPPQRLG